MDEPDLQELNSLFQLLQKSSLLSRKKRLQFSGTIGAANMMSFTLFLNLLFITKSYQFISQSNSLSSHYATTLRMTATAIFPTKDSDLLTIRIAKTAELPRCAGFLSFNMYPEGVPKG